MKLAQSLAVLALSWIAFTILDPAIWLVLIWALLAAKWHKKTQLKTEPQS